MDRSQLLRQFQELDATVPGGGYNAAVEELRDVEFPQLRDATYLDHAGTTVPSASLIDAVSDDLKRNLYGNPHSESPSSARTTLRVDEVRAQVLRMFRADPEEFDLVFVANATAAIKLVGEAFQDASGEKGVKFDFVGHNDAHTSLVSLRNLAAASATLDTDGFEDFIAKPPAVRGESVLSLFAYPAQSNFSGNRLPLNWTKRIKEAYPSSYVLVDAAAYVTTSPLDLSDSENAPDFLALSFYKIFGMPDLGALVVRRRTADIFNYKRYYGGGTLEFVMNPREHPTRASPMMARKAGLPHSFLEDGTVPFHSISALGKAIEIHKRLFGSFERISAHAASLAHFTHEYLKTATHYNGRHAAEVYTYHSPSRTDKQGPTLAFNLIRPDGGYVGSNEVSKLATVRNIHLRTGGLCNPGGIMHWMKLDEHEMRENWASGKKCGDEWDIMRGKPTGAVRISFGAISTFGDAAAFIEFIREFFVEVSYTRSTEALHGVECRDEGVGYVKQITVFPIKSCAGYNVPPGKKWPLQPEGLAYDREFCLVDIASRRALNQKQYPQMTLIKPNLDDPDMLTLTCVTTSNEPLTLSFENMDIATAEKSYLGKSCESRVCGEDVPIWLFTDAKVTSWFTAAVGVECTLARYCPTTQNEARCYNGASGSGSGSGAAPIKLSNESPILVVNQDSVDALNAEILRSNNKPASADVFRGNIVVSNVNVAGGGGAYAEDSWEYITVGSEVLQLLGPCRRCHMVCIDQDTGQRNPEPFSTLSKTRKFGGAVRFGQHARHLVRDEVPDGIPAKGIGTIKVGDTVMVWNKGMVESIDAAEERSVASSSLSDAETAVEEKAAISTTCDEVQLKHSKNLQPAYTSAVSGAQPAGCLIS